MSEGESSNNRIVRAGDGPDNRSVHREMHFEFKVGPRGAVGALFKAVSIVFAALLGLAFIAFSFVFVGIIIVLFMVVAFLFFFSHRKTIKKMQRMMDEKVEAAPPDDADTYEMSDDEWKRVD
ncbi:MAG: hypothetical protein ABIH66_12010 [bacterium]